MQANACCESKQTTICENRGRRSHSLPDLYSFRPIIAIYSLTIIASRPAPVPINLTGVLVYSSMKLIYAFAFSGRSSKVLQPDRSPKFPSNSLYTGLQLCRNFKLVEKSSVSTPLQSYATQTLILSNLPMVSKWFTEIPVRPFRRFAYFKVTRSSQPQRRGLPLTVPYSWPRSRILSPVSSSSSVTNGPSPTRLE